MKQLYAHGAQDRNWFLDMVSFINKGSPSRGYVKRLERHWEHFGDGYVMHGFRHSMRDRSRAVKCPSEMIDQIGGWPKRSVGESYGEGFSIEQILKQFHLVSR